MEPEGPSAPKSEDHSVKTVVRLAQLCPPWTGRRARRAGRRRQGAPGRGDNNPDGRVSEGEGNAEASAPPEEPAVLSSQRSQQVYPA